MATFLEGKVVVVTGAGNGIGRAIAHACAAEGAKVVVNDYGVSLDGSNPSSEVADSVAEEICQQGGEAVAVADSVATMEGGERIVNTAAERFGRLDGVVCVAGILRERMLFNLTEDDWDSVVATHLKGTFTIFRAASRIMREQRSGRMVAFTSFAHTGSVAQANYSAAKGGIISLVRSAALGMHKYAVTANAIAPVAHTRMSAEIPFSVSEIGTPEDVAAMTIYLLSERSASITGQVYTVAGPKIALWGQPREVRAMYSSAAWTPETIAQSLPGTVGYDPMPTLTRLEEMATAASLVERPNSDGSQG
ncbi:NAD(P)-dependent dehydrogenase (short-subunit alcohol dehydrogenase family) [Mycobacteroides chelonae]|nr:NAD(P)-dependent dehydrogenase (short-subunit alcohol dehydrogenase family) [Mycobacteroides chelonae]